MTMSPSVRKLALTVHITTSVGWLGAVPGFLALALVGLNGENVPQVRAAYLAMEMVATRVIVPLTFASLLTGLIQSLGTRWELFRHYWVLIKLLITVVATLLLLVHMRPIRYMADVAAKHQVFSPLDFRKVRVQLVVDAGAALLALLVTTALSVYKPPGLTPHGCRKRQREDQEDSEPIHA